MNITLYLDILIAVGLVVVAIVLFLLVRSKVLPQRSVPIIAGVLGVILGIVAYRRFRPGSSSKRIKELESQLAQNEASLAQLQKDGAASKQELDAAKAELVQQRAAAEKEILMLHTRGAAEKERIDKLSPSETFDEYLAAYNAFTQKRGANP